MFSEKEEKIIIYIISIFIIFITVLSMTTIASYISQKYLEQKILLIETSSCQDNNARLISNSGEYLTCADYQNKTFQVSRTGKKISEEAFP